MHHPRIGLTTWRRESTDPTDTALVKATIDQLYIDGVSQAGGLPLLLPALDKEQTATALAALDAVILSGGGDLCPSRYDSENSSSTTIDEERDASEIALIEQAVARQLPIFGICRGLQVLNVALGGTLTQELQGRHEPHPSTEGVPAAEVLSWRHTVQIVPGSRLRSVYDTSEIAVNSLHHQGVAALADTLTSTATASDGTIEAVESADGSGLISAVQWHPEKMLAEGGDLLFSDFVRQVRERKRL